MVVPASAQVIDLSREWVSPGLMDAHTHVTLAEVPGKAPFEAVYLQQTSAFRALRGLRNAQDLLREDSPPCAKVGNEANYACADVRKAISERWFDGPTMQCAGKIIGPFGGQSGGYSPEQGPFWRWEYLDADTPDEIRKAIHQDIYYGADVIKLVADNSAYFYSENDIRSAVQEAHAAGRPVAVHVYGGPAADNVIRGGADSVEHGFALTDDQLKLMKEKGTFLVGTDFPEAHLAKSALPTTCSRIYRLAADIIDRLRRANKIGAQLFWFRYRFRHAQPHARRHDARRSRRFSRRRRNSRANAPATSPPAPPNSCASTNSAAPSHLVSPPTLSPCPRIPSMTQKRCARSTSS